MWVFFCNTLWILCAIQYSAIIMWSNFSQILTGDLWGVCCDPKIWFNFRMLYVILWWIGPHYNGSPLYVQWKSLKRWSINQNYDGNEAQEWWFTYLLLHKINTSMALFRILANHDSSIVMHAQFLWTSHNGTFMKLYTNCAYRHSNLFHYCEALYAWHPQIQHQIFPTRQKEIKSE